MLDFVSLAQQCAPQVDPQTLAAIVRVESGFNPFAIGVVGARLARQPQNLAEAVATARSLDTQGYVYSVGLSQIQKANLSAYHLTLEDGFEPCANLGVGAKVLASCFVRATSSYPAQQDALRAALSCYYSGNWRTGFVHGYVQKVFTAAADLRSSAQSIPIVPAINPASDSSPSREKPAGPATSQGLLLNEHPPSSQGQATGTTRNRDPRDASVF